ncbi:MAG: hypothetical protein ABI758_03920 [Candidatus Woesebacteria bacterium]
MKENANEPVPRPQTKYTDYLEYMALLDKAEKAKNMNEISYYNFLMKRINRYQKEKILPEDGYIFDTVEEMSDFLLTVGFPQEQVISTSAHEQEHYDKAVELGYLPRVCIWLLIFMEDSTYAPFVFLDKPATAEDRVQILTAVQNLSDGDSRDLQRIQILEEYERHIQKEL